MTYPHFPPCVARIHCTCYPYMTGVQGRRQPVIFFDDLPELAASHAIDFIDELLAAVMPSYCVEPTFLAGMLRAIGLGDARVQEDMTMILAHWSRSGVLTAFYGVTHVHLAAVRHDVVTLLRSRIAFVKSGGESCAVVQQ